MLLIWMISNILPNILTICGRAMCGSLKALILSKTSSNPALLVALASISLSNLDWA
jgi:hypothetical protein